MAKSFYVDTRVGLFRAYVDRGVGQFLSFLFGVDEGVERRNKMKQSEREIIQIVVDNLISFFGDDKRADDLFITPLMRMACLADNDLQKESKNLNQDADREMIGDDVDFGLNDIGCK